MKHYDAAARAVTKIADSYGNLHAVEEIANQFRHEQDAEGVAERIASRVRDVVDAALEGEEELPSGFRSEIADMIRKGRTDAD